MKRVLYIVSNPFTFSRKGVGGNISSASGVVNALTSKGYLVDILSDSKIPMVETESGGVTMFYYPNRWFRSMVPINQGGRLRRIFSRLDGFLFQMALKKSLKELLKIRNYTFVYMRASYNGHVAATIVSDFNVDLVVEVNKPLSMGPFNNDLKDNWPLTREAVVVPASERIQYDIARLISVDSSIRAKWIIDFVGDYQKKIVVNHNGVDVDMFAPICANINDGSDQEGQDLSGRVVVGVASSFRWYNDIEELCRIFALAYQRYSSLRFYLVVGDREKLAVLEDAVSRFSIKQVTSIKCEVPFFEMPALLDGCDILVSHFNFHGKWPHNCSIKHLEYLSMGKPVVATAAGDVNFAIEDGVNGFLKAEGDAVGFAEALVALAKDPILRKKLGNAGRSKAVAELSWSANASKIVAGLHEHGNQKHSL